MSPYKIEMFVSSYTKDKEPLYKIKIYDSDNNVMLESDDKTKEQAIKAIADYCCVLM
jgi:hypothetical protein